MKKAKRFVDYFLTMLISLGIVFGISKVVEQLTYRLPSEGTGEYISLRIMWALYIEVMVYSLHLWEEVLDNAGPVGEGYWKRVRKNLLEEICAVKWIMVTVLIAIVVNTLTTFAFLFIVELVMGVFKNMVARDFLMTMLILAEGFLLFKLDLKMARFVQSACKKKIHQ